MESAVKDLIEPFLYPHNLFLWGLLFAVLRYRKTGLLLLFVWFYAFGNGYVANQVRHWYNSVISVDTVATDFNGNYVVLGCGGSATAIPDCARSRLDQLSSIISNRSDQPTVHITTMFCQPYLDYLRPKIPADVQLDCFYGGATTYHEFYQLADRLDRRNALVFVSSDYHAFRVKQLADQYLFNAKVFASPSSTFRPVNCGAVCFLTVNLSNYDLFAKLMAEMSSFYVYDLTKSWTDWYKPDAIKNRQ